VVLSKQLYALYTLDTNFIIMRKSMSNVKKTARKDSLFIYIALAFIAGFLSGAAFTVYKMGPEPEQTTTSPQSNMSDQQIQAIAHLEQEVTGNPDKFQAWTQLANLYYDTGQYPKAVKAYEKSLELHSGNANIWTDLGVMYRRTNQPQKAIEAFDKAIAMEPSHQYSRMNKGIVLMYDLDDTDGAIEAWEGLLKINPDAKSANGDSIREFVENIKTQMGK
jgi:cytochrome c-type biogenesis protein CcmH/NrfG